MGRWTQYDEDSYRLPEGMVRVGYDADTGEYTFRDRSGTYFNGVSGCHYGPMRPQGRLLVAEPIELVMSPQKAKRRAAIAVVPNALRSLRRSLTTTVRKPWRRDHSSGSDDEEPVLVSRPSSPLQSEDSAVASTVVSKSSANTTSKSFLAQTRTPKPGSPPIAPWSKLNAPKTRKLTSPTAYSSLPTPPPKDNPVIITTTTTSPRSSTMDSKVASVAHSRSASTSAARSPTTAPQGRSQRSASEHVHSTTRDPIETRSRGTADTSFKTPSSTTTAPPVIPGSVLPQKVPSSRNRRRASEQTPSSSASARSTATTSTSVTGASPRPRTSAPLARSVSTSLPRTSRTMAMEPTEE
ncbi:hypothetical protein C8F04DRAFT_212644 [Mycena alexandri]|uniref:Uncharacterized protein n=1 Tax=Mycena alexandri TaxID=1745969 RepID=A0AAD6TK88_9AGAR|nr:hypothetical protein C8F04DRAFT_212644 [Mycena alexandri]